MTTESSTVTPRRFRLVVGLPFSDAGTYAFEQGMQIARRIPGAALHLVHVVENDTTEPAAREITEHLRLYAEEKASSLGGLPDVDLEIHVRVGHAADEIAGFADEIGADLVVLGARARHLPWHHATTTEQVIAQTSCPVVIAGPRPPEQPHGIAIDPACPDCLKARATSHGATWWCARHGGGHHVVRPHVYSYRREVPLRSHDSEVVPTGIDMGRRR